MARPLLSATPRRGPTRTSSAKAAPPPSPLTRALSSQPSAPSAKVRPDVNFSYGESEHPLVRELLDIKKNLGRLNKLEAYHDALERREDAHNMFTLGVLELPDKAKIEHLYWEISQQVVLSFSGQAYVPEEIRKLEDSLGDQYLCNFSVFQSLLDHWALGQLFPIMPI